MKKLLTLAIALTVLGCSSSRRSVDSTTVHKDTAGTAKAHSDSAAHSSNVKQADNTNTFRARTTIKDDTAIGIAARHIKGNIAADELGPVTTATGRKVPHSYRRDDGNGIAAWAVIDTNGNLQYGCDADSLTFVVQNLLSVIDSSNATHEHSYDSLATEYRKLLDSAARFAVRRDSTATTTTIVKQATWWGRNWKLLVIGAIALVLIGALKYFKIIG